MIVDPRRFGTGELLLGPGAAEEFFEARLGLEPFDDAFTAAHLKGLMRGRRAPIKALLLDQRLIAGIGNIYADEALFRARIHPRREAGSLTGPQYARLREGIIEALAPASRRKAPRSTTSATSTAYTARSRTSSWCTSARVSSAKSAGGRS